MPAVPAFDADRFVTLCDLFSSRTRLAIVRMLIIEGEMNVTAICNRLSLSSPVIGHHIALLCLSRFIESRRDGHRVFYSLSDPEGIMGHSPGCSLSTSPHLPALSNP